MKIAGFVLIAAGILALVVGEFTYSRRRDTVEVGPLSMTVRQKERVTIPRVLSVIAIIAGAGLVAVAMRRPAKS